MLSTQRLHCQPTGSEEVHRVNIIGLEKKGIEVMASKRTQQGRQTEIQLERINGGKLRSQWSASQATF